MINTDVLYIGWDFDIFQKIAVKFPTPGKNVRSNITKFPTQRNDFWSRARTKIQISLPPGQQENSNALLPGQGDRSKSHPMQCLPPCRLDIDRCIMPAKERQQISFLGYSYSIYINYLWIAFVITFISCLIKFSHLMNIAMKF